MLKRVSIRVGRRVALSRFKALLALSRTGCRGAKASSRLSPSHDLEFFITLISIVWVSSETLVPCSCCGRRAGGERVSVCRRRGGIGVSACGLLTGFPSLSSTRTDAGLNPDDDDVSGFPDVEHCTCFPDVHGALIDLLQRLLTLSLVLSLELALTGRCCGPPASNQPHAHDHRF